MATGPVLSDREVLLLFKRNTAGDFWKNRQGWDASVNDLNSWFGVTATSDGRVIKLELKADICAPKEVPRLVGRIPAELGKLSSLQTLDVSRNQLTGQDSSGTGEAEQLTNPERIGESASRIPAELGELSSLEHLNVLGNRLTGRIPAELGELSSLQALDVSRNQLTGSISAELGKLSSLEHLNVLGKRLTGSISAELGELSSLQALDVSRNHLTGSIPAELGKLSSLEHLNVLGNRLTGSIPAELGKLKNLQTLFVSRNQLTGRIPAELGKLSSLEHLNVLGNRLTGSIPVELGKLSSLQTLFVSGNQLTGAVPAQFVKLHNLWDLSLAGNNFSGPLPSLKQLEDLFDILAGADSSNEEPLMYPDTSGQWKPRKFHEAPSTGDSMETASTGAARTTESLVYPGRRRFRQEARKKETLSKVTARIEGFEGDVMAWSFDATAGVIGCPDFELDVPHLGREYPALIGQSSTEAEMIDEEFCLLHPIVTCLSRSGDIFSPPLLLRFPVGDIKSIESGSDTGSNDDTEESYYTYLKSRYSVVKREEGSATWVPISGKIYQMDNSVFVLEAEVSHFTDYALKQAVKVDQGEVKIIEIKKLPHESRRNVFLFVNQGSETIVVHYWRRPTRRFWISRVMALFGFGSVKVGGEVKREILENQTDDVYNRVVYPRKLVEVKLPDTTLLEVAWATQEDRDGYKLVNVWGRHVMDHRTAMVIGPLQDTTAHAHITDLKVPNGVAVGNEIRAKLARTS